MGEEKKENKGIESKIENMDPKLKKLLINMISIFILLMIAVAILTIAMTIMEGHSFMAWFNTSYFVTVVIVIVFLGFAYKILTGGKIVIPEKIEGASKKQFNIPDTWGVKKQKPLVQQPQQQAQQPLQQPSQPQQKLNIPNYFGQKPQEQQTQQNPYPNPFGQKPQKRMNIPNTFGKGSVRCPNCGSIIIGDQCGKCGYRR